jgi:hypothetical protein
LESLVTLLDCDRTLCATGLNTAFIDGDMSHFRHPLNGVVEGDLLDVFGVALCRQSGVLIAEAGIGRVVDLDEAVEEGDGVVFMYASSSREKARGSMRRMNATSGSPVSIGSESAERRSS